MALDAIDSSTLKISNTISTVRANAPSESDKETKKVTNSAQLKESATDVKISQSTLFIQSSSQDINVQKVEQIKLAIQQGQLTMDASKIADSLIAELKSDF